MDETEKYQQRLEAIAEKRRQQEEQDRARRDMEDEKIRMQQLKRKSLRDQWLMEGAPLSPKSPDAQIPGSPQRGSQTQELEEHSDKLEPESQRLAEDKEKEQTEDGQVQEAVKVSEAGEDEGREYVVQNGDNDLTLFGLTFAMVIEMLLSLTSVFSWWPVVETTGVKVTEMKKSPPLARAAVALFNGGGDCPSAHAHHEANGAPEGVAGVDLEPGLSLGVSDAQPGRVSINHDDEEEEEGTLVIRAECVMVTDDGDDAAEDPRTPGRDQEEPVRSEGRPNQDAGQGAGETFAQAEASAASEPSPEAKPEHSAADVEADTQTNGAARREGENEPSEDPAPEQTAAAAVPVYSEMQPFAVPPGAEEMEAVRSPEGAQGPPTVSGQFQEVPLADPGETLRTEAREQEPLLTQAKAPEVRAEPADGPVTTDTHSPARAGPLEETPKRKTCQCCSVM